MTMPPLPSQPPAQSDDDAPRTGNPHAAQRITAQLSGQQVSHFTIGDKLGSGAMSSVYRAVNTDTGAEVALKMLLPGADPVARSRFRQEARTAVQLRHPHIVRTLEVGELPEMGISYIAMELVNGDSLGDLLERTPQLSAADASRLLEPVARALDYAHRQGIVHRDVKPSNILLQRVTPEIPGAVQLTVLDEWVVPLLSDFGIARALDAPELTSAGRTIGTPAYMAPEQCEGAWEIDGRADIYALGAVYYRCLVGRPPFTGTTTQILYAHVYSPLMLPDEVMATLPAQAVETLRWALMKAPEQRYQSAAQMADVLETTAQSAAQSGEALAPGDATMTMTSLPSTERGASATMLVPAPTQTSQSLQAAPPRGRESEPRSGRRAVQPVAWAVTLVAGLGLLAIIVVVSLQLLVGDDGDATAGRADAQTTSVAGGDAAADTDSDAPASSDSDGSTTGDSATTTDTTAGAADDEPSAPIPVFDIESVWGDAEFFYTERDWANALETMTLVLRRNQEFNNRFFRNEGTLSQLYVEILRDRPDVAFWAEHQDYFDEPTFSRMLTDLFTGLALNENALNRPAQALAFFEQAQTIDPDAAAVAALTQATADYVNAAVTARPAERARLQQLHIDTARELAAADNFCAAADQLAAAVGLLPNADLNNDLVDFQDQCAQEIAAESGRVLVEQLDGTFIYSTNVDNRYRIYATLAAADSGATLLIEDGSQPSVSPVSNRIAFYSTQADSIGLSGFDVGIGLRPSERSLRYTEFIEDGLDSPAGWSPDGERLVFSSRREGDRRDRVYVVAADGSRNAETLAFGKDPAWHPSTDLIVYNGVDLSGNRPGLWFMRSDGSGMRPLTDVATDIRPVWSPDGEYVVFMSSSRDGSWDVYRIDLDDGAVTRLTDDPAQDGIPAVSPDGRHVAFFSDRGGRWSLWVVPSGGGEAQQVLLPQGSLERWLEHSLQWVD